MTFCRTYDKVVAFLVETLPFYHWTDNDRFKEGSLYSFHVILGSEQADEGTEEDGPATNPLRLHRVMRNQRESVAHFVSGRAFLPARNERTVRQQHHRPSSGVPSPSVFFCFPSRREMSDYNIIIFTMHL